MAVTNTTHTETSTTASTTESSTSYTETSTTASTTTGTETSTSDTDTAARTTATSSSTTTTSTTTTTRLSTTTATSTATESMVVGDVAAPGGEDRDHLPDQLEATTSFWAKAEMVAIMASILGVILVASIIIAVAAWRKSSAEIAGKKTTWYSTHHGNGNGNGNGNGLRKKPTGMVSMFALDAAAKQQTNLWHQASSFVNGRRRRSTSGSVGSVGSLTIPSWTSGRASVTSLPASRQYLMLKSFMLWPKKKRNQKWRKRWKWICKSEIMRKCFTGSGCTKTMLTAQQLVQLAEMTTTACAVTSI